MGIAGRIAANDVLLDVTVASKRELLELLSKEAASRLAQPASDILAALQSREDMGSTAVGHGAAIPHAELEGAASPLMIFARLRRPLDFDARDDEPVDLVFLVLWPASESKGLIDAIAGLCRALRQPEVMRRLRGSQSQDEIARLISDTGETAAA